MCIFEIMLGFSVELSSFFLLINNIPVKYRDLVLGQAQFLWKHHNIINMLDHHNQISIILHEIKMHEKIPIIRTCSKIFIQNYIVMLWNYDLCIHVNEILENIRKLKF